MQVITGIAGDFRVRNIADYQSLNREEKFVALRRTARLLRFQAQDLEVEALAMEIEAQLVEQGV
jgi:hypothetical protein